MCSPNRETPPRNTYMYTPTDMCSPTWETHILSDICFSTREADIPSDMCSLPGKQISLVICRHIKFCKQNTAMLIEIHKN